MALTNVETCVINCNCYILLNCYKQVPRCFVFVIKLQNILGICLIDTVTDEIWLQLLRHCYCYLRPLCLLLILTRAAYVIGYIISLIPVNVTNIRPARLFFRSWVLFFRSLVLFFRSWVHIIVDDC